MGIIANRMAVELYGKIKEAIVDKHKGKNKETEKKAPLAVNVRLATEDDAEELLSIYRYYVEETAISYEYVTPSVDEFRMRIRRTLEKYPYFVAEKDGRILGYAYAGPFVGRAAYAWAAELTIYLDKDVKARGIGRVLYGHLEDALSKMGIQSLYACIGYPEEDDEYMTKNSAQFHEHMGYKLVGEFYNSGYKFDRWYTMIWMEKQIGTFPAPVPEVIPYPILLSNKKEL